MKYFHVQSWRANWRFLTWGLPLKMKPTRNKSSHWVGTDRMKTVSFKPIHTDVGLTCLHICIRLTYPLMYISSPTQAMWSLLTHLRTWGTSFHVHKELNQRIALPCNVVLGATERFIFNYETILTVGDFDWNLYITFSTSLWKFDKWLTNTCFPSHIHQAWNSCFKFWKEWRQNFKLDTWATNISFGAFVFEWSLVLSILSIQNVQSFNETAWQ